MSIALARRAACFSMPLACDTYERTVATAERR